MTLTTPDLAQTVRVILAAGQDTAADIMARVAERWDLSAPLPVPRPGWLVCPICQSPDVIPREWRIGARNLPRGAELRRLPYRVDVSFKCLVCSMVWWHGIAVSETDGRRFGSRNGARVVHWREGVGLLRAWAFGHDVTA